MDAIDHTRVGAAIAEASYAIDLALVGGSPDAVASHFTEDAVLGESGMEDCVGREAVRQMLARGNEVRAVVHHALHRTELHVYGEHAVELGWFDETKRYHTGNVVQERGRSMTLWRYDRDGVWRIHRLVTSPLPAVE